MKLKRIYLEITNICNLNCSFCSPLKREKRFMNLEKIEDALIKLKATDAHIYPHIKGEPLMHPDFDKFALLCRKHGFNLNVTTNGVFIDKYKDILLEIPRQVNISIHALTDGQIEKKEEYLLKVLDFLKRAEENKKPNVSIRFWTENQEELSDETFELMSYFGKAFNTELPKKISKGRNALKLCDNIYISLMNKFEWPDKEKKEERKNGTCLGGREMLGILADGTVVPCCLDADGEINLGNIFEEALEEILKKERYIKLKDGFTGNEIPEELCRKCTFYMSRKGQR